MPCLRFGLPGGGRDEVPWTDRNASGDAARSRPRDSGDRISDAVRDGLFTCTNCQACWKVCPKDIQIPGKAIEKLRSYANKRGFTFPRHLEVAALVKSTGGA